SNKQLFNRLVFPIASGFIVALGVAAAFYYTQRPSESIETDMGKSKPLDLQGAWFFGLVYTVILLVATYSNEYLGEKGMLLSSAIAGLSDIDAITISVSKIAGESLSLSIASNAVLIATVSNTIVKLGIGMSAGSLELRKHLFIGYGIVFISIVLAFL